jgi:hypothetical protein
VQRTVRGVGRRNPDRNVTFRLDPDVVDWARFRAFQQGTSLSRVLSRFLEVYAAIPEAWWERRPPPWTPGGRSDAGWAVGDPLPAGFDGPNRFATEAVTETAQDRR